MKKQMIAGMLLLVLTVSGCSAVSTAPAKINELAEETRAEAETESTDTALFSESKVTDAPVESKAPQETENPESTAVSESSQPIEKKTPKFQEPAAETTPVPTDSTTRAAGNTADNRNSAACTATVYGSTRRNQTENSL